MKPEKAALELKEGLEWLVGCGFSVAIRGAHSGGFHARAVLKERAIEAEHEQIEGAIARVRKDAEAEAAEGIWTPS
jgi:hypothetical protein